tara:strand:- start:227 stop:688 length:462 start_codon:yes stop_codon:yes gene_type:complete
MRKLGLLLLITLLIGGCSATAERMREGKDLNDMKAKYENRYIVTSSKPKSKIFNDVDLICTVQAKSDADKTIAKEKQMKLRELEGRSGREKDLKMGSFNNTVGRMWSGAVKYHYHNCMNKSGWDTRSVCVKNCSAEERALYDLKRAEYKARYP